jgi:uncharacterized Fe-S center protein
VAEALAAYDRGQEELRASQAAFLEAQEMEAMVEEEEEVVGNHAVVASTEEVENETVVIDSHNNNNNNNGAALSCAAKEFKRTGELTTDSEKNVEGLHVDAANCGGAASASSMVSLAARVLKLEALAEESWAKQVWAAFL